MVRIRIRIRRAGEGVMAFERSPHQQLSASDKCCQVLSFLIYNTCKQGCKCFHKHLLRKKEKEKKLEPAHYIIPVSTAHREVDSSDKLNLNGLSSFYKLCNICPLCHSDPIRQTFCIAGIKVLLCTTAVPGGQLMEEARQLHMSHKSKPVPQSPL